MNMRAAMADMVKIAKENASVLPLNGADSPAHFEDMLRRMKDPEFSEAKLGRWLGWCQGALYAHGVITLDEAKEINKRWA